MARITIDVDLPPEVEITGYQRYQDGHGLEVRWLLPTRCRCEKCGHDDVARIEFKTTPQAIRDLDLWEQPCFWIYQAPSTAARGVTTASTSSPRSSARTCPILIASSSSCSAR